VICPGAETRSLLRPHGAFWPHAAPCRHVAQLILRSQNVFLAQEELFLQGEKR
jgi:hypothetical protein